MVFSDDLPAAQRACSATLIPLLPVTLLLVIWLLPSHARACGNAALCGDHIDAFFLPLLASSLTGAPAAGAAEPVADMPATALPDKPVIISPPADITTRRTRHARLEGSGEKAAVDRTADGWGTCKAPWQDRRGPSAKTG